MRALEGTGFGEDLWSPKGDRFVFVTGRGHGEAELNIASADGTDVRRLTDDGKCKWSPVFDPAGRRIAYAAATWGGEDGTMREGHLRVLDLLTGEEEHFRPPGDGICGTITWSPDGSKLYYDWRSKEPQSRSTLFEAALAAPAARPGTAPLVAKPERTQAEEVLAALNSDNSSVIEWGTERIEDVPVAQAAALLKIALGTCRRLRSSHATREVVACIGNIDARELAPDVVAALDEPFARPTVIRLLAYWKVEAARVPLERIVRAAAQEKIDLPPDIPKEAVEYAINEQVVSGVDAAWALVILGQDSAWNDLVQFARSRRKDVRIRLIDLVAELRDPRSVVLLIGLLKDTEAHHLYRGGELGDAAAVSLKSLTGESFGRDAARWLAWWKVQGGKLPERP